LPKKRRRLRHRRWPVTRRHASAVLSIVAA
jgi:hypothetical protein